VGTQVSGTVAWLGADFNSIVHQGQVIAKLDPSLVESQVQQSRASLARANADLENARIQLKNAQQKYTRTEELWTRKFIAQVEFDASTLAVSTAGSQVKSAEAQVTQAAAALHQNELALSRTVIQAPIDGIVIQRSVDVGQTVSASVSTPTVFAIAADLSRMQVNAGIDESDIARIRPTQSVRFQVDAYPGNWFDGSVKQVRLQPTLVQNVTTYSVIIDVPNPELKLKPGMTANLKIELASRDDVVRIPNAALRFRPTTAMYVAIGQAPPPSRARTSQSAPAPRPADEGSVTTTATIREQHPDATTVDALFAPLAPVETAGEVWLFSNGRLTSIPVRLGISDGQMTELLRGDLLPDVELVTNVTSGEVRTTAPAATGGIFMQGGGLSGGPGRQGGTVRPRSS
jgi:HlyD family secretion protein